VPARLNCGTAGAAIAAEAVDVVELLDEASAIAAPPTAIAAAPAATAIALFRGDILCLPFRFSGRCPGSRTGLTRAVGKRMTEVVNVLRGWGTHSVRALKRVVCAGFAS
jgi:hypothetical protein